MKFKYFALLALLTTLAACNPTLPPPPPGWSLELRAGTTNIDRSFFQNTKPDATRSSVDQTRFAQLREAIVQKVPNFNLGSALASGFVINSKASTTNTRETAGLALSLFMAVSKDGAAPKSDLSFVYSGPTGAYDKPVTYPANNAWIASPLVIPKGNGQYTFSSTLQDGTLAGNVSVNLEDQTQWLPFAQQVSNSNPFASSMAQYGNVFIANWQPVPGAQSYLGLIFDRTDKKYVGTFLTKGTRIESQDFAGAQDHVYSLDLIATSIDLTKDNAQSYGALPGSMQSSIFSFGLNNYGGAPNLFIEQARVNVLAKPNQTSEAILKIKNLGTSPLGYTATISGTGLELSTNAKSIVLYDETREIHVKGTCTNADLTGTVTLTTNDPNNKTKVIPVTLECDMPVSVNLVLKKSVLGVISSIHFNNDGDKLLFSENLYPGSNLNLIDIPGGIIKQNPTTLRSINFVDWRKNTEQVIAVSNFSGTAQEYDSISWNLLSSYEGYTPVVYSPDGKKIAISQNDSRLKIFDLLMGSISQTLGVSIPNGCSGCSGSTIQSLTWSPDSSKIATGGIFNASKVKVYDVSSGDIIWQKDVNYNYFANTRVLWSPDGKRIATSNQFFNANIGDLIDAFDRDISNNLLTPFVHTWSPDSRYVLIQKSSSIELWNANSYRKILSILDLPATGSREPFPVDWNSQSNQFAITDGQSSVYIYKFSQP